MKLAEHLSSLLKPINSDNPAGVYLKEDRAAYRALRNLFNVAQTSFRQLTNNPAKEDVDELQKLNRNHWEQFSVELVSVISDQSKDLECISWLALAQIFTAHPYENLTVSLQLMTGVVQQFGEQVQPRVPDSKLRAENEAEKTAERAAMQLKPVSQVFGASEENCLFNLPLRMLPLIADIDYMGFHSSENLGKRAELQKRVRQALSSEQGEVVERVLAIGKTLSALDELDQAVKDFAVQYGAQPVSFRFLRQQLTAILNAIKTLTEGALVPWPLDVQPKQTEAPRKESQGNRERDELPESDSSAEPWSKHNGAFDDEGRSGAGELIYNRDQAFQQLRLIADYFARTEPQSPVSSLLEKAIRWGYTPLTDLMNELVQGHDGLMGRISELTGMNANKIHIPGAAAKTLVPPPQELEVAPSRLSEINVTEQHHDQDIQTKSTTEIPSFVNLTETKNTSTAADSLPGPGGIDLASLGIQ